MYLVSPLAPLLALKVRNLADANMQGQREHLAVQSYQ